MLAKCALICTLCLISAECAKILGVCHYPMRSHYILCSKLMMGIAARGHEVTLVSWFSQEASVDNFTEILIAQNRKKLKQLETKSLFTIGRRNFISQILHMEEMITDSLKRTMEDPHFEALLASDEKFDLVILHSFMNEAMFGLAHRYRCPLILFSSLPLSIWTNHLVGNVAPYSYSPTLYTKYSPAMSFYERLVNTMYGLTYEVYNRYVHFPRQEATLKKYFKGTPDLDELMYNNISMIFLNSHVSVSGAKPLVPAMIEIGGFHIDEPEPLPTDLQEFMDNATQGVIFFSLGSNIAGDILPPSTIAVILNTFSKLKQKVLWKLDSQNFTYMPHNVKLMKWFPQTGVMAHPNLKVFITQGGILSLTEAVYYGVPIIGFPIFVDQAMNVQTAVEKGLGIGLNLFDMAEEIFTKTLRKIIEDPRYLETAREHSSVLRDQAVKPLDSAIFWAEHVIRHKGATHLRTPAMHLHWTQIYLLDVISVSLLIPVISLFSLYILITKCCSVKKKSSDILKKIE